VVAPNIGVAHAKMAISVRLSFKHNGELLGVPLITYTSVGISDRVGRENFRRPHDGLGAGITSFFAQQAVGADVVAQLLDAARRLSHIVGIPDQLRDSIRQSLFGPATADTDNARASAQATAPVVWLLGKTGAGKTAIIAALTGDARAEIGLGFEPCTRTAAFYDVPPEAPLLRFLDTRGRHRLAAGSEASHLVRTFATTTASLFNLSSQLG
jgi:hypothetical protein